MDGSRVMQEQLPRSSLPKDLTLVAVDKYKILPLCFTTGIMPSALRASIAVQFVPDKLVATVRMTEINNNEAIFNRNKKTPMHFQTIIVELLRGVRVLLSGLCQKIRAVR